jgi:hypothetical protein
MNSFLEALRQTTETSNQGMPLLAYVKEKVMF